jgi:hypothetical protein
MTCEEIEARMVKDSAVILTLSIDVLMAFVDEMMKYQD